MAVAGVRNFSMNDLNNPTPQRVTHILSNLINFATFSEMRLAQFQRYTERAEILMDQKAQQEARNEELADRISSAKYALALRPFGYPLTKVSALVRMQRAEEEPRFQTLSEQRAAAVKAFLVSTYGVDAGRLETKGYGASKPAAANTTPEGRQQNRRVELVKM